MAIGAGEAGRDIYLRNNKQQSLGPEQSLTEVGNPPPHNLIKLHVLVAIKQQQQQQQPFWRRTPIHIHQFLTLVISSIRCGVHNTPRQSRSKWISAKIG